MTKPQRFGFWVFVILVLCAALLAWVNLHKLPAAVAAQIVSKTTPVSLAPAQAAIRPPLPTLPPPEIVQQISAWSPPQPPVAAPAATVNNGGSMQIAANASVAAAKKPSR
jgi:hypothetical protein